MGKSVEKRIEGLDLSPRPDADEGRRKLQAVCAALKRKLFKPGAGDVRLEPGFLTTMGYEQKVVVEVSRRNYRDVLFRAYVPVEGYPVEIDFYGEEPTRCASQADIDKAVGDFLERPEVIARLKQYRDLAR